MTDRLAIPRCQMRRPHPIVGGLERELQLDVTPATRPSLLLCGLLGVSALIGAAGLGVLVAEIIWNRVRQALLSD